MSSYPQDYASDMDLDEDEYDFGQYRPLKAKGLKKREHRKEHRFSEWDED